MDCKYCDKKYDTAKSYYGYGICSACEKKFDKRIDCKTCDNDMPLGRKVQYGKDYCVKCEDKMKPFEFLIPIKDWWLIPIGIVILGMVLDMFFGIGFYNFLVNTDIGRWVLLVILIIMFVGTYIDTFKKIKNGTADSADYIYFIIMNIAFIGLPLLMLISGLTGWF